LGVLAGALSITTLTSAQETMTISDWAKPTISHGSRFGIYPFEWHYDNFNQEITLDKFEMLLNNVAIKLDNPTYTADINQMSLTRENILNSLYQTISIYDSLNDTQTGVEYFVQNGLIQGDGTDLRLNDIATTEESVVFATRLIEQVQDVLEKSTKGVAWEIRHNDNTAYLFGVVHLGPADLFPINADIRDAYYNSDYLVLETTGLSEETAQKYMEIMSISEGTIADYISVEMYDKLLEVCELYSLPLEVANQIKPYFLASELGTAYINMTGEISSQYGTDAFFIEQAMFDNKPILELEDVLDYKFDDLPQQYVEDSLSLALDMLLNPSKFVGSNDEFLEVVKYYIQGDLETFSELAKVMDDPTAMSVLYGERDQNMAEEIDKLLQQEGENTYFIAVGAGHYVVDDNILDRLEDMGYEILDFYN
ncbi:MAG: hypothetical protein ATN35_05075, partial [Epulopiscium sp. Nele67-Bin004]